MLVASDPAYADLVPVPQDDGPDPPAPIAYNPEYTAVMDLFRAVLRLDEVSPRALALTTAALDLNPANYTVWLFRRRVLEGLGEGLGPESEFSERMVRDNEKNYQVWHHRRWVAERAGRVETELALVEEVLEEDAKNYHAWAHRQWAVAHFGAWERELPYTAALLEADMRNNSAWSHRAYVLQSCGRLDIPTRTAEIDYAFGFLRRAPNNESAWNYARAMCALPAPSTDLWTLLAQRSRDILARQPAAVHAHATLVLYGEHVGTTESRAEAAELCDRLVELDGQRAKYWRYKRAQVLGEV